MPIDWDAGPQEPVSAHEAHAGAGTVPAADPATIAQLQSEAELLALVQFWREKAEALADEKTIRIKRWRRSQVLTTTTVK